MCRTKKPNLREDKLSNRKLKKKWSLVLSQWDHVKSLPTGQGSFFFFFFFFQGGVLTLLVLFLKDVTGKKFFFQKQY